MEIADFINQIAKNLFINILIYFVFIKLINYKNNNKYKVGIIVAVAITESIVENLIKGIPTISKIIIMCIIYGAVNAKLTKNKLIYSTVITFISLTVVYSVYIISIVITGVIVQITKLKISVNNICIIVIIAIIESLILRQIFKIKRIKNGVPFLQNEKQVSNVGTVGIILIGMSIIAYSLFGNIEGNKLVDLLFAGIVLETVCLFIWLKRKITVYYRQRLKERTVEELESEIRARDERICEVVDENSRLAEVNHKFSSRIRALEDFSCKVIERPEIAELMRCEFGNEFADFEEAVKNVSEEFSSEMKHTVIIRKKLPKTGVFGVDNLLEYMCKESAKNGIDFDVKINGNILFMVQKIIDSKMLETLLGDHIKDAIIAINSSQNTYKNILVTIGIVKECYEISIYDTGIEFEIDTLLKLGLERITTHKSTGGSGIGFMTTFETLAKTKASLIIEEKHPITNNDYTKIVRIRFDGKKEYRIKSYRQNEIEGRKVDKRIKFEKT